MIKRLHLWVIGRNRSILHVNFLFYFFFRRFADFRRDIDRWQVLEKRYYVGKVLVSLC